MSKDVSMGKLNERDSEILLESKSRTRECPLRAPAQHVKKSIWAIYMTVMLDVFSHSSWNGW